MVSRNDLSPRTVFTGSMSVLATVFGCGLALRRIGGQADILTDTIKIAAIIAIGTAVLSLVFWTATHFRNNQSRARPIRGAVAGMLTALFVIPLPVFSWKLKTDVLAAYDKDGASLLVAVFESLPTAIGTGLQTFSVMTKASLIAVILSTILGYSVSRWWPDPLAGTSPRRP